MLRSRVLVFFVAAALSSSGRLCAGASDDSAPDPQGLVGATVNVHLRSGKKLTGAKIEAVRPGKTPGTVARLRVLIPDGTTRRTLEASTVEKVVSVDGEPCLVWNATSRTLALPDADGTESKHRELMRSRGVRLWTVPSDEAQKAEVKKRKAFLKEVAQRFSPTMDPNGVRETKYFVVLHPVVPDNPAEFNAGVDAELDVMHEKLCVAFGIRERDKLWLGKAAVILFSRREDFDEFERIYFEPVPKDVLGLAHVNSDGSVVISCLASNQVSWTKILIHEATHGFSFRYKSAKILPNWLNEGISEWVAITATGKDQNFQRYTQASVARLRQQGSLGGDFFTAEHIAAEQYVISAAMVDYLIESDPKGFHSLIERIKSGEPWEAALQKVYGVTPGELTQKFGAAVVGAPYLRP